MFVAVKVARCVARQMEQKGLQHEKEQHNGTKLIRSNIAIDEETTLLNDSLFSRDAVSQYQEKKEKYDRKKKVNIFLIKTEI